jgi:hypothetical protein
MAEISIGSAVGAGFGLIARRPVSVLTWGLVRILFAVASLALIGPMILGMMGDVAQNAAAFQAAGPGAPPPQAAMAGMMSHMLVLQGVSPLIQLGGLFLNAILACAIARAVIHPDRSMAAYLRLGGPEFFLAVLSFAAGIALVIALFICAIPFAIAIGILASNHMWAAMVGVIILGVLVLLVAIIYVLLRFAFVAPMMVDDGRFHLFDAWTLTKGHVGALFVIGLCLLLILFVGEAIVGAIFLGLGAAGLGAAAGGLTAPAIQAFVSQPPSVIVAHLAPWLVAWLVIAIPIEGCAMAILIAPWARAYRDAVPPAALTPVAPLAAAPPPAAPTPEPPPEPSAPEPPAPEPPPSGPAPAAA